VTESQSVTTDAEPAPAFRPDTELIEHLEGNERSLKGYRAEAEQLADREAS
jgi:hypothetical protein